MRNPQHTGQKEASDGAASFPPNELGRVANMVLYFRALAGNVVHFVLGNSGHILPQPPRKGAWGKHAPTLVLQTLYPRRAGYVY